MRKKRIVLICVLFVLFCGCSKTKLNYDENSYKRWICSDKENSRFDFAITFYLDQDYVTSFTAFIYYTDTLLNTITESIEKEVHQVYLNQIELELETLNASPDFLQYGNLLDDVYEEFIIVHFLDKFNPAEDQSILDYLHIGEVFDYKLHSILYDDFLNHSRYDWIQSYCTLS